MTPFSRQPQILDKEEVDKVRGSRDIPDIKPGYIVQLRVVGLQDEIIPFLRVTRVTYGHELEPCMVF